MELAVIHIAGEEQNQYLEAARLASWPILLTFALCLLLLLGQVNMKGCDLKENVSKIG